MAYCQGCATRDDHVDCLKAENAALKAEQVELIEGIGQKLAACDIAAMSDTQESHERAKLNKDNSFWSPAYESVMRRTAECIALRAERDALRVAADEALVIIAGEGEHEDDPVYQILNAALSAGENQQPTAGEAKKENGNGTKESDD